jgi:hypothetical protein
MTLVSMLYDIAGMDLKHNSQIIGDYRRKTIDQYLEYGEKLVQLDVNLLIFVQNSEINQRLADLGKKYNKTNMVMIAKPFEMFKWYHQLPFIKINDIANPIEGRSMIKDTDFYRVCVWEKFECLKQAMTANPFKSTHFGWIDFGVSYRTTWPTNMNQIVNSYNDKVKISLLSPMGEQDVYRLQKARVDAGFFTGCLKNMFQLVERFEKELQRVLVYETRAPMEETIMYELVNLYPKDFLISWSMIYDRLFSHYLL